MIPSSQIVYCIRRTTRFCRSEPKFSGPTLSRGYSWELLVGGSVPLRFSKSWPYFRPKYLISFYSRFQLRPTKLIPNFRADLEEILSYSFRLELNTSRIRMSPFLSYSFGIEMTIAFIHSRSFLENHTRFQTKMGKFSSMPFGATHACIAYIREYPLGLFPKIRPWDYFQDGA